MALINIDNGYHPSLHEEPPIAMHIVRFLADRAGLCPGGRIPFTLDIFVGQLLDPLEMQVRKNGSLKPP